MADQVYGGGGGGVCRAGPPPVPGLVWVVPTVRASFRLDPARGERRTRSAAAARLEIKHRRYSGAGPSQPTPRGKRGIQVYPPFSTFNSGMPNFVARLLCFGKEEGKRSVRGTCEVLAPCASSS